MKILVTGNKGFIASNLIRCLQGAGGVNLLPVCRDTTTTQLYKYLDVADYIFHLAGEVRPGASAEDYINNNSLLTKLIIDHLIENRRTAPLLMVSSYYAVNPGPHLGIYGQTKRECELYLEQYQSTGARIIIYRLPHVFGEGAKPNHNSVITTWIYNMIHRLPIKVYDRTAMMTYCYVQDVVREFVNSLIHTKLNGYLEIPVTYVISLGDVVDYIEDIANGIERDNEFYSKLKVTYHYYQNQARESGTLPENDRN